MQIDFVTKRALSPRAQLLLILFLTLCAISGAFFFQFVKGLLPCALCLLERWPYYLAFPLALASFFLLDRSPKTARFAVALIGLLFFFGALLGLYHVGIEENLWKSPPSCSAQTQTPKDIQTLREQIRTPMPACQLVPWRLFGISLAGYHTLLSFFLLLLSFHLWSRLKSHSSLAQKT